MRLVMKVFENRDVCITLNERPQRDLRDRYLAVRVLFHHAFGFVSIGTDLDPGLPGEIEEPKHVAVRQRRHEQFFRVDRRRIAPGCGHHMRGGRGGDHGAAVEAQFVNAGIAAGEKVLAVPECPDRPGDVLRHQLLTSSSRSAPSLSRWYRHKFAARGRPGTFARSDIRSYSHSRQTVAGTHRRLCIADPSANTSPLRR